MGTITLFPFVVVPGFFNITDFPKTLYLYILSIFLLVISLWKIFSQKMHIASIDRVIFLIGIVFFGITYVSADMNGIGSVLGSVDRSFGFIALFSLSIVVYVVHLLRFDSQKILFMIFSVGVISAMIGIMQKYGFFGSHILGQIQFEGRVAGTLGQYNAYGAFLALTMGVGVILWRHTSYSRIFLICGALLMFGAILFSGSRLAMVGAILVGIVFFPSKKIQISILSASCIGLISLFFVPSWFGLSEEGIASIQSRKLLYQDSLSVLGEYSPTEIWFGRGVESQSLSLLHHFSPKYLAYEQLHYIPDRAHMMLLDTSLQFGIFGLIIFLCIFLFFPIIVYLRYDGEKKDIALILLVLFLVHLFGFYDAVNVFFLLLLVSLLIPDKTNIIQLKRIYGLIPVFLIIILLSFLPKLSLDRDESRMYDAYMSAEDEFDRDFQRFIIDEHAWGREVLLARILAREIDQPSDLLSQSIQRICESDDYVALQVCARILHTHTQIKIDKDPIINKLLSLAPYDPIILSMRLDDMMKNGKMMDAKKQAEYIIGLFPDFIYQDDLTLTAYQKRKKQKILEYYPFYYWKSIVQ